MNSTQKEIELLIRRDGVIARRDHPQLSSSLGRLVQRHQLVTLLPGVYVPIELCRDPVTRIRAAAKWDPDAVLTGEAAAKVSFWPRIRVGDIDLAVKESRLSPPGFRITRRQVPPELIVEEQGLRFTCPALTSLDLCLTPLGGSGIDNALRTGSATLRQMHEAVELTKNRRGNIDRRALLLDSRDEPWSEAERLAHRILRAAGITGWKSNAPVETVGSLYWVDILFEQYKLIIEIDGRAFHGGDPETGDADFEVDRWRQNHLVLQGYRVIRFTWAMLTGHPEQVVAIVRQAIAISA